MYYSNESLPNKIYFNLINSFGFDGFVGGTVNIDEYHDFNGNGELEKDKYLVTASIEVEPKYATQKAVEIAQAAVNYYGTNSYMADMEAINAYMFRTYKQTDTLEGTNTNIGTCIGGANVQKAWSIYKYNVFGAVYQVYESGYNNTGTHEAFYPVGGNPYTKRAYFEADGHNYTQGQTPESDSYKRELVRREANVAEYKAAGK